ncbi:MAG TPA: hypothetical protein DCQ50_04250 [Chryseobacterium sp.]|nr:hypothetical protein [Chryseobacterium sp.]
MTAELDLNEIDHTCRQIRDDIIINYPYYKSHVHFLYYYGCRIGELFNYRISYDANSDKLLIDPQKKNNVRSLTIVSFDTLPMLEELQLKQDIQHINKRNLQRIIEKVNIYRNLKTGNKKIGAHLFRHNWIKKQVAAGKQFEEINQLLGYTSQSIQDTYLTSKIYY